MRIIAVEITVHADQAEAFKTRIIQHSENTLEEDGCRGFDVAQDLSDPARFMIWECYRDDEAIEEHKNSPHLAAMRADTKDMVKSRNLIVAELLR
jgi:autoinducer 2-degrading protein